MGGGSAKDLPFGRSEACLLRPESTLVRPRPHLDLTFVYTTHCKPVINIVTIAINYISIYCDIFKLSRGVAQRRRTRLFFKGYFCG